MAPARKRVLPTIAIAAIATLLASGVSFADEGCAVDGPYDRLSELSEQQRDLVETAQYAVDNGNCAAAWDQLWTAFRQGDHAAATTLAEFIVFDGLVPPGSSPDRLSQERHATILALHGLAAGTVYSQQVVDALFETPDEPGSFIECLNENPAQPAVCVDEAVYYRLVPNRFVYIAETEALARAVSEPAICSRKSVLSANYSQ